MLTCAGATDLALSCVEDVPVKTCMISAGATLSAESDPELPCLEAFLTSVAGPTLSRVRPGACLALCCLSQENEALAPAEWMR